MVINTTVKRLPGPKSLYGWKNLRELGQIRSKALWP